MSTQVAHLAISLFSLEISLMMSLYQYWLFVEYDANVLWTLPAGPGWTVSGQIIGVKDNILIANSYSDDGSKHRLIGIRVSAD